MIKTYYAIIKAFIKSQLTSIRAILIGAVVLFLSAWGIYTYSLRKSLISAQNDAYRYESNMIQYQSSLDSMNSENRVLRLDFLDMKYTKDSLLIKISELAKKKGSKIKPGDSGSAVSTEIYITDTVEVSPDCTLDTIIYKNPETSVDVKLDSGLLKISTNINNSQVLYVHSQREYVNRYKNLWVRFWKFDWKKAPVIRYDIENSNNLIKIKDIKVVNIE